MQVALGIARKYLTISIIIQFIFYILSFYSIRKGRFLSCLTGNLWYNNKVYKLLWVIHKPEGNTAELRIRERLPVSGPSPYEENISGSESQEIPDPDRSVQEKKDPTFMHITKKY